MINNKRITFIKYTFSYLMVFLIPISGYVYLINTQVLSRYKEYSNNSNLSLLSRSVDELDMRIKDMKRIALSIPLNKQISNYNLKKGGYEQYAAWRELNKYIYGSSYIDNLLYIPYDSSEIYSSKGIGKIKYFSSYDFIFKEVDMMRENPQVTTFPVISSTDSNNSMFAYMITNESYALAFVFEESYFQQLFNLNEQTNHPSFFVMSDNTVVLSNNISDSIDIRTIQSDFTKDDYFTQKDNFLIYRCGSSTLDWTIYSVSDNTSLNQGYENIKSSISLIAFGISMISLLVIAISLYQNYIPIYRIRKKIENSGVLKSICKNELEIINSAIEIMTEDNKTLSQQLKSYQETMRKVILNQFSGNVSNEHTANISEWNQFVENCLLNKFFLFCIEPRDATSNTESVSIQLLSMIKNELDLKESAFLIDIINNQYFYLVSCEDSLNPIKLRIKNISEIIYADLNSWITVSGLTNDPITFSEMYNNLNKLLQIRKSIESVVVFFDDYEDKLVDTQLLYPHNLVNQFSAELSDLEMNSAYKTLQQVLSKIDSQKMPDFFVHCLLLDIINQLFKLITVVNVNDTDIKDEYLQLLLICSQHNNDLAKQKILSLFNAIHINITKKMEGDTINVQKIIEHIKANCYSLNFSFNVMASDLGISPVYLSRMFKKKTGMNISDIAWNIRLNRSKELLETTHLTLQEITEQIGFCSCSSFIRKFKLSVSMTPGEYRQKNRRLS